MFYKYKLEGSDQDWVDKKTRREAVYSNLRPGTYQFHVSACNEDGVWNESEDALQFVVPPRFYETPWFYVLCGGLTLMALVGVYAWRVRHLKTRQKALQKAHDLLEAANTTLKSEIEERKRAEEQLRCSEASLAQAQRLSPHFVRMDGRREFLRRFRMRCIELRRKPCATCGSTRARLPPRFLCATEAGMVVLRIKDTGQGFATATHQAPGHGYGLSTMRERAQRLGGKIEVETGPGAGTELKITVPFPGWTRNKKE